MMASTAAQCVSDHLSSFVVATMKSPALFAGFMLSSLTSIATLGQASSEISRPGSTGLLDVFQIEAPVRESYEGASCQQVILEHEFAASYGSPYVGKLSLSMSLRELDLAIRV
jgi:hypothetical protein